MDRIGKFLYFPSFSAGEFGHGLLKNHKFRGEQTVRFYSDEFPEQFRTKQFLITAGANFRRPTFREDMGFTKDNLLLGDSGGYQIASGALKWKPELKPQIFEWLENNTDWAVNLDIPPRLKMQGKFGECMDISMENFKYFYENQSGKTKFLGVVQGDDDISYQKWYNTAKDFHFQGWSIGGASGNPFRFMSGLCALLEGKEHLQDRNEVLHILGTSRIKDFFLLIQLQKSLEDVGSKMVVTTDSSTPDRSVVYGMYYTGFSLKKGNFEYVSLPRAKHKPEMTEQIEALSNKGLVGVSEFDKWVEKYADINDIAEWTWDGQFRMRLHNYYLFCDAIKTIEQAVYQIDIIKEQMMDKDMWQVIQSLDEMIKSDKPREVFNRNKRLYEKISSVKKSLNVSSEKSTKFFQEAQ